MINPWGRFSIRYVRKSSWDFFPFFCADLLHFHTVQKSFWIHHKSTAVNHQKTCHRVGWGASTFLFAADLYFHRIRSLIQSSVCFYFLILIPAGLMLWIWITTFWQSHSKQAERCDSLGITPFLETMCSTLLYTLLTLKNLRVHPLTSWLEPTLEIYGQTRTLCSL